MNTKRASVSPCLRGELLSRVMVVGPCGSGKSTFARRLGEMLRIPVVHMDSITWSPGWVMTPRHLYDVKLRERLSGERWVLDGNTGSVDVYAAADTVVFLDFARWVCMWRVIKRIFTHLGRVRPDMAEGCPERLDFEFLEYAWNYRDRARRILVGRLEMHARDKQVIVLNCAAEVETFFRDLGARCA